MRALDDVLRAARENPDRDAIISRGQAVRYGWLIERYEAWRGILTASGMRAGEVAALEADFSPESVAALLALIDLGSIIVPLSSAADRQRREFHEVAEVEWIVNLHSDPPAITRTAVTASHGLYRSLREIGHPGLILFSSGSTGRSKAALHDFARLLEKFATPRQPRRMLAFLLFDHIGGVNTLLYSISNAGTLVTIDERTPRAVCAAIAEHRVEVLPATPTFLHLLLLSDAAREYDLSSLSLVTYGTEVMPEHTLRRFHEAFPNIQLQQTYGLSELGILRSKSRSADSLWVRIGGDGFETRVRDGLLEIRARSAMLGYLNAPSPFTDDGWFKTGDAVEVDGDYFRILGRRSEIINVGGEKVFPAEVETILELMDGVDEAAVSGEPNAITGNIVTARVKLSTTETLAEFRKRMREFCRGKLAQYQVPQKVTLVESSLHGDRFKKIRRAEPGE